MQHAALGHYNHIFNIICFNFAMGHGLNYKHQFG